MKTSDFVAHFLERQRVPCVFELVGGMITHLLDSLDRRGRVRSVSMHHEQAAAFAADAMGRILGTPGVAMATSGPGATNLVTGIASCYFDSSPAVFLTGQVNRGEQKGSRGVRQLGFQETDIVSIAAPVTKAAWQAQRPEDVPRLLRESFRLAVSGRPGPVLLDLPMDVQREEVPDSPDDAGANISSQDANDAAPMAQELLDALARAERPLIVAGGGLRAARCRELFRTLASKLQVPVVHSLRGVDALPYGHPMRVGMIGTYGNRWANLALGRADFLLVLGSRLDVRQTGSDTTAFRGEKAVFHVDADPAEINNRVTGCRAVVCRLQDFLPSFLRACEARPPVTRLPWREEIATLRAMWPDTAEQAQCPGIHPNLFMHELSQLANRAAAFVVDVGQHQMWAAQSLELGPDQLFLTSGGMGSMGFALPASIGAAFALRDRPIVAIAGDGGFQCNLQELETVVRNGLPLKIVVVNNRCLGMVRQFQQSYFEDRYCSTLWGYSAPDFARVAAAYGIASETVEDAGAVRPALTRMWRDPSAPSLLQVMVNPMVNAYPKVRFGRPVTDMEPQAAPRTTEEM